MRISSSYDNRGMLLESFTLSQQKFTILRTEKKHLYAVTLGTNSRNTMHLVLRFLFQTGRCGTGNDADGVQHFPDIDKIMKGRVVV